MSFGGRKIFKFYLVDRVTGRTYFVDEGGRVQTGMYTDLRYSPEGWLENRVSFGRSSKYYGINRTFTVPLKFVGDGAQIIRTLFYTKRGIEQPLGIVILKWNPDTDIYELYYKGVIDLTKIKDDVAEGVTVNVMEGGVVQLLKAFDSTVYQIPCDGTIPENVKVKLDGQKFRDTFHYEFIPFTAVYPGVAPIPLVFTTNEGDNINVIHGDQNYEELPGDYINNYLPGSPNYCFSSGGPISVQIKGKIKVKSQSGPVTFYMYTATSLSKARAGGIDHATGLALEVVPVFPAYLLTSNMQATVNGMREFTFDHTINLAADERLFILFFNDSGSNPIEIVEGSFDLSFDSIYKTTETWGIAAFDLFKILVRNINQSGSTAGQTLNYQAVSKLLEDSKNYVVFSGDALRAGNDPTYPAPIVIKTSLSDFFESFDTILGGALSNQQLSDQPESLFFEKKGYVFDSSVVTMDIGEVAELDISVAEDYYFNSLTIGYPNQEYDQKAGKYEFNTTAKYLAPIKSLNKELTKISKYRADSYGIEYTRFNSGGKSTTHNNSDNSVFVANIDRTAGVPSEYRASSSEITLKSGVTNEPMILSDTAGDYCRNNGNFTIFNWVRNLNTPQFRFVAHLEGIISGGNVSFFFFLRGVNILTITKTPGSFNETIPVDTYLMQEGDEIKVLYTSGGASVANLTSIYFSLQSDQILVYPLKREVYDVAGGIINADTAFNIEGLTPARILRNHFDFLKSTTWNLIPEFLKWQTLDRNQELSTTKDSVTITENASIPISSMGDPLFYGFVFSFKTKVPLNFMDILGGAANGHIRFTYNGKEFFGFPLEVSQKPALNESQDWKLLCSPKTKLSDLVDLNIDGLNYIDMAGYSTFIPHLNPVHFVPLGLTNPAQYHSMTMDQDWFKNRIRSWVANNDYFNPWQNNDIIKLQLQTNGLGPVQVDIMDCEQDVIGTIAFSAVVTNAVKPPYTLYEANIPLTNLDEGIYYLLITAGTGTAITKFVSEPLYVKEEWPETLLIEYSNNVNKQASIFTNGYNPSIRVHGRIVRYEPGSKFAVYENQPADIELLNGIPFDTFNLELGFADGGIPDYKIRKIARIMLLTSTYIEGTAYTRNGDAKFERTNFPGQPREYWTLNVRFSDNRDGITLSTDGTVDQNITIVYNINAAAFGENSGVSNVIQVEQQNQ